MAASSRDQRDSRCARCRVEFSRSWHDEVRQQCAVLVPFERSSAVGFVPADAWEWVGNRRKAPAGLSAMAADAPWLGDLQPVSWVSDGYGFAPADGVPRQSGRQPGATQLNSSPMWKRRTSRLAPAQLAGCARRCKEQAQCLISQCYTTASATSSNDRPRCSRAQRSTTLRPTPLENLKPSISCPPDGHVPHSKREVADRGFCGLGFELRLPFWLTTKFSSD